MNKLDRLNIETLQSFGAIGASRAEILASAKALYTRLGATSIEDFRAKSDRFVPKLKAVPETPNGLRKAVKAKYAIAAIARGQYESLVSRYRRDIIRENLEEIKRIADLNGGNLVFMRDGTQVYYRLGEQSLAEIQNGLLSPDESGLEGSDAVFALEFSSNISGILGVDMAAERAGVLAADEVTRGNPTGGFLTKGHTMPHDFSRYGCFSKDQDQSKYLEHNCLYRALEAANLSAGCLARLSTVFFQRDISIKNLKLVAELLKIRIVLRFCNSEKSKKLTYGAEGDEFHLCLIESHFFVHEPVKFTSFYLKNYGQYKDMPQNTVAVTSTGKFSLKNDRFVTSKELMEIVLEKYSYNINRMDVLNTVYHTKLCTRVVDLDYETHTASSVRQCKPKPEKGVTSLEVFFDCETVPDEHGVHQAREVSYRYRLNGEEHSGYFVGYSCAKDFVSHIYNLDVEVKQVILIAHNAMFDCNFLIRHLSNIEICKIGSRLIYIKCRTKKWMIVIKDSMNFVSAPLRTFSKTFGLEDRKLDFDFDWIKLEDLDADGQIINPMIMATEKTPKDLVDSNGKFNIVEYARLYNCADTKVLADGFRVFSEWTSKLLDLNLDDYFTVSSLADAYVSAQGCFAGCYELAGVPQAFINQAVLGGRVMTQDNRMILLENCSISTLDANSLYPSAMAEFPGFLRGSPKMLLDHQLNHEFLDKQTYFFVDIRITRVGRERRMPLIYRRTENSINYVNHTDDLVTVGKLGLEDMVQFHEIEYEIIRGYYFNAGFNTEIKDVIMKLYDRRNELKKEGNKGEQIYKLIMNSIYGKTLQKPRSKSIKFMDSKREMIKYITRNSHRFEMAEQIAGCDKWLVREYVEIASDFNKVHIGAHILDYSKRIMNRVICLCEDLNIDVYYTDTDSIHMNTEDIQTIEEAFYKTYKKRLIGDELGQFKRDFGRDANGNELVANSCAYISKKTYCCHMSDGHDHYRAKGITQASIMHKATTEGRSIFDIYKDRYNGVEQEFDLTCGGSKVVMKQGLNMTVRNIYDFTRKF